MTQAEIFRGYMAAAWDGTSDDNDFPYEEDAMLVAAANGGKFGASNSTIEHAGANAKCVEYLFPDGSIAYIICDDDGIGCGVTTREGATLP